MVEFEGRILTGESFDPIAGRVVVEDGRIAAVEETGTDSRDIVVPAFVNAHTHIGDSVAKEAAVGLSLEEAVVPPDSLKHRRLRAASHEELVREMRRTMGFMEQTGTAAFMDFREFGLEGARVLREAEETSDVTAFIFGSDDPEVLDVADGFGASGATDEDFTERRQAVRDADARFAIHAGEPDDTDIHPALDLDPHLLIHMVHAAADHMERVEEQGVAVTVCPRANLVLDTGRPPIGDLLDHTTVALGTDNVMLNPPSMFQEMAYTAKTFDVSDREVLHMATAAGAEIAGLDCGVIEPGKRAALFVLDGESNNLSATEDPVRAVVRRATGLDVTDVVL